MNHISYQLLDEANLKEIFGCDEYGMITVPTASHNNCGSRCVIKLHIQNGKISGLSTDCGTDSQENPQIRSCVKGHSYLDTFLSPERILYPRKRVGKRGEGRFTRISWDEAIQTIAREMTRIKETYGPQARYCNYATGYEMCAASPSVMIRRLLALDGGYLGYYNNYSCSPSMTSANLMYGTIFTGNSRNDYVNSKLILLWGFNPAETCGGGNTMHCLLQAKRAGAKIIVIDSRFSDTAAALADQWIAPKPTTDNALSDAMAYVIYHKRLHNADFLHTYCLGFDSSTMPDDIPAGESYLDYLLGTKDQIAKTPAWASQITGIRAEVIEALAIEYASAKPAAILEGYGPGRHAYGEQFSRGLITLACMTGNVGIPGGSAAGLGMVANGVNFLPEKPALIPNPYPGQIPCFLWTDVIDQARHFTPEQGLRQVNRLTSDIKMIFNLAGNCLINQHGNCGHTADLLSDPSKVEMIVCSDLFLTPSARYADLLLPGTSMLETENITASPARFDEFFKINPVIQPAGEARFDYDWICDVAEELGLKEAFSEHKTLHDWLAECAADLKNQLPDFPDFDTFTKTGVYKRNPTSHSVAFYEQIKDPQHVPFPTPSGKIELFVRSLYEQHNRELNPLPGYMPAWEGPSDPLIHTYPLQCIGFHTKVRTHSVHDNNKTLQSLEPQRIWINPLDADARGIAHGDLVQVFNSRGTICLAAKVTERIRPGITAIPQGAWYTPDQNNIDRRGCINTLTSLRPTPIAKANAQHTNLVEVKKADSSRIFSHKRSPSYDYTDSSCSGCFACVAACPHGRMKVLEKQTNDAQHPVFYQPVSCDQCQSLACKAACPLRIL